MVGQEFMDHLEKLQIAYFVGAEDFADQLSFLYTVMILIISSMVVSLKEYFFTSLTCYSSTAPAAKGFEGYISNYCWVHGTVPVRPGEVLPHRQELWEEFEKNRKINYYQWIPFLLGLQAVFFYLPRLAWQILCYTHTDTNLQNIIETATSAVHSSEKPTKKINYLAEILDDMFYEQRYYGSGKKANFRRKISSKCSFCLISKRLGTWLVFAYFFCKLLFLTNAIGQLYFMRSFLGFNDTSHTFGINVLRHIMNGNDSRDTLVFPRVAFCNVNNIRITGASNNYVAQCALPINMISEKIYIFLWFWCLFVAIITLLSIPLWILRMGSVGNRMGYVKKTLKKAENYDPRDHPLLKEFIREFLRHDGVFLIRMIALNAGDLVTAAIIKRMFEIYKTKNEQRLKLAEVLESMEDQPMEEKLYPDAPEPPDYESQLNV